MAEAPTAEVKTSGDDWCGFSHLAAGLADYAPPKPVQHREAGWVYFIGGDANCIKIGWAKDPMKRLRALQTGCPVRLFILAVDAGPVSLERDYHARFSHTCSHGEWFQKHPALNDTIEGLAASGDSQRFQALSRKFQP